MRIAKWGGLVLAVLGAIVVAADWAFEPIRASYGLLIALQFGYTVAGGALLLLMIGYVTDTVWLVVMRRPIEAVVGAMPIVALLFVPVLVSVSGIWSWAAGGLPMTADESEHVMQKLAFLNEPFFLGRSVIYLVVPILLGEPFLHWSRKQDREERDHSRPMRVLAAVGMPVLVLTMTFAIYDWIMGLEPSFYSTSFGAIPATGGFLALLGILITVIWWGHRRQALQTIGPEHTHALGKVMLTAVIFWAYLAFTQYLIIWIGDLPVEARWFLPRTGGGWLPVAYFLIFGHFAVPFFALLFADLKRHAWMLATVGLLVAAAHWVELWWMILPAIRPAGPDFAAADIGAMALILGAIAALGAWRISRVPLVPRFDPLLGRALRYRAR